VQGAEGVRTGLRGEAFALQRGREPADVVAGDPQPVGVGLDRRRLTPRRPLRGDQRLADDGERPALLLRCALRFGLALRRPFDGDLRAQLAESRLGLCACEPVGVRLGVDEAEPALHLAAAVAPLGDPRVALGAGAPDQRPAAVPGGPLCARHCRSICLQTRHLVVPLVVPLQPEVASTLSNSTQLRNLAFTAQMLAN
jgi:hypothetical protein